MWKPKPDELSTTLFHARTHRPRHGSGFETVSRSSTQCRSRRPGHHWQGYYQGRNQRYGVLVHRRKSAASTSGNRVTWPQRPGGPASGARDRVLGKGGQYDRTDRVDIRARGPTASSGGAHQLRMARSSRRIDIASPRQAGCRCSGTGIAKQFIAAQAKTSPHSRAQLRPRSACCF